MRKDIVKNFAVNWLSQQTKTPTKGEKKLLLQFATIIDKLMEVSVNEK